MGDLDVPSRNLSIKRYERDKLIAMSEILSREIRITEIDLEKGLHSKNIMSYKKQLENLAKVTVPNDLLTTKKNERDRLSVSVQISSVEIRTMELDEEIIRCRQDIEAQKKQIAAMDFNIKQQQDLIAKGQ
jgi:cell division protein FtsL